MEGEEGNCEGKGREGKGKERKGIRNGAPKGGAEAQRPRAERIAPKYAFFCVLRRRARLHGEAKRDFLQKVPFFGDFCVFCNFWGQPGPSQARLAPAYTSKQILQKVLQP